MKRIKIATHIAFAALALSSIVKAENQPLTIQRITDTEGTACGLPVTNISMKRSGNQMNVGMKMNLGDFDMKGDRAVIFVPVIVNGNDSVELDPVGLYGRIRYIQYIREYEKAIGGANETTYKYKNRPGVMEYTQNVAYRDWMNGAKLYLRRTDFGCCNKVLDECNSSLTAWNEITYTPTFYYVTVTAETVKTRELSGRAFIDFPVNQTVIYPDYRNNTVELAKIVASIDSVKNDKDITIDALSIKGFASPEGSYTNNIRLAKGRTEALKTYVQTLYHFPSNLISTSYEPEDWEGLREYVVNSNLPEKNGILAIIDSNLEPDPKNTKIQTTYPETYKFLLQTVYPGLRHSDYKIEYTIRSFTDINEIAELFVNAPYKLSLNELIKYAQSLEEGSDEYNNVYETAARLYPNSDVANLNAANSAMQRGDLVSAEMYLSKAGEIDAAIYARGVLSALKGDYAKALELFKIASGTISEASEAAAVIEEIINN